LGVTFDLAILSLWDDPHEAEAHVAWTCAFWDAMRRIRLFRWPTGSWSSRCVRKAFDGNVVLDGIDLTVQRGEAVVVAGPSGAGKSTMLHCMNGLESIDAGAIAFDGERVDTASRGISRLRAEIGAVFQQFDLFPHLTVERNVTVARSKCVAWRPSRRALGRGNCWLVWASSRRRRATPPTCRAASSSASRLRALAMEPKLRTPR